MKKTKMLSVVVIVLVTLTLITGCGGGAKNDDGVTVLRIANPQATGDNITLGYEKLAELVEEKSNGTMRIDLYSNAVLGSDRATTEAVQEGTLDMASCSSPNFAGFIPEFMAFDLPYITDKQYQENLYDAIDNGELGDYYRNICRERGFEIMMFSEYGYRNFAMADKQVTSAADFKGVKLRTTDSPVEIAVAKSLGAQAMPVAWGETYTALSQGTIDGEGNTWSLLLQAKHNEALKYGIESRHNYSMHILVMNKDIYDSLTDEQKQILREACQEALDYERGIAFANEAKNKQIMIDAGTDIYDPTEAEMQEFKDLTAPVWDQFVGKRVPEEAVKMIQETQRDDYQKIGDSNDEGKEVDEQ